MAPPTIFTRPRRQIAQTQSAAFDEIRVPSYAELLNAITNIASRGAGNALAALGGSICIIAPFNDWAAPVIIPEECPGLTIRAISLFPLRAATAAVSSMFDVRAEFVTIKDIFSYGDADGYFTTFATTGSSFTSGRSANNLRLFNNVCFADRVFVDASSGKCDDAQIVGNWQNEANASHSAAIVVDSPGALVSGNSLEDGGGDSITVGANASRCAVVGNDCGGGDITSNASGGFNTISANRGVGAVVAAGTDDSAGGNTA